MDDSDTSTLSTPQIILLLSAIALILCLFLVLFIWKFCLPCRCRGCLDIRRCWGGGRQSPKQGEEESGLAFQDDRVVHSLPRDQYGKNAAYISLERLISEHHRPFPRRQDWARGVSHPNEAHTRSHQTGMTRHPVPNPDARRPLGQPSRHQEKENTSTTHTNPAAIRVWQTETARRLVEASTVPYTRKSPSHTLLPPSHTNTPVQSRRTSSNSELQDHPVEDGHSSPKLPAVEAHPPRLHTPRFSRQAFVFDANMILLVPQSPDTGSGSKEVFAGTECSPGVKLAEEEVAEPCTRVPSCVSENPPPSYRTEPPQDSESPSRSVSCDTAVKQPQDTPEL